jgi:hypothetical protein
MLAWPKHKELTMKLIISTLLTIQVFAASLTIVGPCSEKPIMDTEVAVMKGESIGDVTVKVLEGSGIDYIGSPSHMQSIAGSPHGIDAMEILSDTKLRSHGWCYKVNGETPPVYPNDVDASNSDNIMWYFCYVSYDSGVWASEHRPTYLLAPSKFCGQ